MRPARARIDLAALLHNHAVARRLAGGARVLSVVKADAYGHGAAACARSLQAHTDGFGVACIEEAIELRDAGITAPIVLLEGFFEPAELALIERYRLWTVIASPQQLDALEQHTAAQPWTIWLKLDSGMHRLGFDPRQYADAFRRVRALPWVGAITAMTHFARADEPEQSHTAEQADTFGCHACALVPETATSQANSAALLAWPRTRSGWVRPGLMLYGTSTLNQPNPATAALRPVMQLESAIIAVRELGIGEPIGYGGTFVTTRPTRVGVVALGYADGYPQGAPEGTPVMVHGQRTGLIGRVSMDMLTVDLTDIPSADIASPVELWGRSLPVAEVARATGTTPYRLLSGLKRVARHYGKFTQ